MIKSRLTVFVCCLFVLFFLLVPSPARTAKTQGAQSGPFDSVVSWYSGSYVQVSWDHDATSQVLGHNVYRFTSQKGFWEKLNEEPFQPFVFVDSSAPSDTLLFYRVTAISLDGSERDIGPTVQVNTGESERTPSVLAAQAYDKNNIITDSQLTNAPAMSQTQIQSFLNSQGSVLANFSIGGKTAAQHIYDNCQIHGISPYVVLVTLQKEKGLIRSGTANPNSFAMGWNTGDSSTSDFASQIYYGTRQFRRCYDDLSSYGWTVGQPHSVSDGTVTPVNTTTASLYIYTPWIGQIGGGQPNVGGNHLFWSLWYESFQFDSPSIAISDGFDYPIGSTGYATEANDGDGWYNAQDFGVNNHLGEDWNAESGGNTDCGLPVYAASRGTIVYAANAGTGWGNVLIVRHQLPDGSQVETLYGHVQSFLRTSGDVLRREQIATIGDGNGAYACHLHFELRFSNCPSWGQPGPGYSSNRTGWTDPSNYIDGHRSLCGSGSSESYRALGNRPPIHPNGTLIKLNGDPTVYLIRGGQKRWVTSPSVLASLYQQANSNFSNDVITVASDELNRYPTGANVSSALPSNGRGQPEGRLIRQSGGTEVSIVTDGGHRRPFATQQAFLGLGYQFCKVVDVGDYSSYPQGPPVEAMPIITASISMNPPGPYSVGQTINGTFSLTNIGSAGVTLAVVTIGGRLNGSTVTDFPFHTNVTLNAGQTITYQDNFTFSSAGGYGFFPAYQTQDGVWRIGLNHEIPTDPGVNDLVTFNVTNCNAPGSFSLISPTNGQSLSPTTSVTLSWGTSANANSYDVYFGTSSNPPLLANQPSTSRSVSVTPGQTYYWKIVARVSCNSSLTFTTAIWSFSVQPNCNAPGAFSLTSPTNGQSLGATTSVTLSWGTSANADSYDVYFGTSSNPPLLANQPSTSRSVSVTPGQTYYWKIVARVSCNSSLTFTTAIWSFSVQSVTAPDLVVTSLTAPTTGNIGGEITVSVTLANQGSANAGAFRLGFYFSTDGTITTGDIFTGWSCDYQSGLAAGASSTCSGPVGVPSSLTPGTYYFGAIVDDLGQVVEGNETNNSRSADTGTIMLTGCTVSPITLGQTVTGALTTSDCNSPVRGNSYYADRYSFNGSSGQRVAILLTSSGFDTYLYLIGPNSSVVTQDDDGGGGTNSRIPPGSGFFTLPLSGTYIIEATSFNQNATGNYALELTAYANKTLFDFDSDRKTDLAFWRPSNGVWNIINSSNGSVTTRQWGVSTDVIVPGDYDGDGKTDVAVYRGGTWLIINSADGSFRVVDWGIGGDIPVPADYDGDGRTDIAAWRPSAGVWYIIHSTNGTATATGWGINGDIPVPADYDGDGKADIAAWRPSAGVWYIINSGNGSAIFRGWGNNGDKPVPADYDGDAKADIAVWRPSSGSWFIISSLDGSVRLPSWGISSDKPVPGDYDGDGKADIAVWRPSDGNWYIINSSNGSVTEHWGLSGDKPIPSAYVY